MCDQNVALTPSAAVPLELASNGFDQKSVSENFYELFNGRKLEHHPLLGRHELLLHEALLLEDAQQGKKKHSNLCFESSTCLILPVQKNYFSVAWASV